MAVLTVMNATVAKVLQDDENGASYDTPYAFKKALMKIGISPETSSGECEADGQVVERGSKIIKYKITVQFKDLTPYERSLIYGRTSINGVDTANTDDDPPEFCLMFKAKKTNKKYKYYKFLKVKFSEPKEDYEGTTKITFPGLGIEAEAIPRMYDGNLRRIADEDDATYTATMGTNWFASGDITVDKTPPTISSTTPANSATTVALNASFVWTFSKAIQDSCVIPSNFFVIKDTDGSIVAGTLSINAVKTIVTFTPTSALAATTVYRAMATSAVKDMSGNALAANDVRKFTTTA